MRIAGNRKSLSAKCINILIAAVLLVSMVYWRPIDIQAVQIAENITIKVNGQQYSARVMSQDYANNEYVSLRDLFAALNGTEKSFNLSFGKKDDEDAVFIKSGAYSAVGGENEIYDEEAMEECGWQLNNTLKRMPVVIDDRKCFYYGISVDNAEGNRDFFMGTGDIAMALNLNITYDNHNLIIDTASDYTIDINAAFEGGLFYSVNGCVVGDATTGEVYFSYDADRPVAIASTTKLMTYYVIMDGVTNGEISLSDNVTFSKKAETESNTPDGVIKVTEGQSAPIMDVIEGMLIKSSNECALALAEHLCGSEEAFVERMNAKAIELGLSSDIKFYNCNGLPIYDENEVLSAKCQNRMTANDMFRLVSSLLTVYPQVTEITSIKKANLDSLQVEINNTNTLLYNIPEVVGLKTGTTIRSGSCLVAATKMDSKDGTDHYIVTVEYGAESQLIQSSTSMIMMKYGMSEFGRREAGESSVAVNKELTTPEQLIATIVNKERKATSVTDNQE